MLKYVQEYLTIRRSRSFDPGFYLLTYPDVRAADVDPLAHFIRSGWREGRDPSADFSTSFYLERNPDVRDAGMNPLLHYIRHGVYEGRQGHPTAGFEGVRYTRFDWRPAARSEDAPPPHVSIVIPVYNALAMTQACLTSLYDNAQATDFEVIVVNNASQDGTDRWLDREKENFPNLSIATMARNVGFGPAVNIGLQRSQGQFIVILNNDTLVSPGWLERLLDVMNADPTVGIVSPSTNYVGHGPQIDPEAHALTADQAAVSEYARKIAARVEVYYEANRLVFFCVMLRRDVVNLIGFLDEGYEKGNFEDDDYCLRARMAGYRLAIARNAFVFHHGTATFKLNQISHDQWMEVNRGRFYEKTGRISVASVPRQAVSPAPAPTVSVVVRTKDRPHLLRNALQSLANQTRPDLEVVLVNDGGQDVAELVQAFSACFPITYVFHPQPKGRTPAVNAGLQRARGEWIACLDDDDILYPWHFEALLRGAEESGCDVVYGDVNRALFDNAGSATPLRLIGAPPWEYNRGELLVSNYMPIHTYIHRRALSERAGPWNEELDRLEDYEFLLRLSALSEFYHVHKVTCEYRFYLDSMNSIFLGRERYPIALERVYALHPVEDEQVRQARQQVFDSLDAQSKQVLELQNSAGTSAGDLATARREIIRLTTGL